MQPKDRDLIIDAWVRPLSFSSIRIMPFEKPVDTVDPKKLLQDICHNYSPEVLDQIKQRYLRLSTEELDIFLVPAENVILKKIVWPLRSAKAAFCLSDYLACIALCGFVCEMAVVFICDLVPTLWDLNTLKPQDKETLLKGEYEKWGQKKRVKHLKRIGAITERFAAEADAVRKIRREYIHFLTKDFANLEADAYEAYKATFNIVKPLVALPIGEKGKIAIPRQLRAYLDSKGIVSSGGN